MLAPRRSFLLGKAGVVSLVTQMHAAWCALLKHVCTQVHVFRVRGCLDALCPGAVFCWERQVWLALLPRCMLPGARYSNMCAPRCMFSGCVGAWMRGAQVQFLVGKGRFCGFLAVCVLHPWWHPGAVLFLGKAVVSIAARACAVWVPGCVGARTCYPGAGSWERGCTLPTGSREPGCTLPGCTMPRWFTETQVCVARKQVHGNQEGNPGAGSRDLIQVHGNPDTGSREPGLRFTGTRIQVHEPGYTFTGTRIQVHGNPDTGSRKPGYVHGNPDTFTETRIHVHGNPDTRYPDTVFCWKRQILWLARLVHGVTRIQFFVGKGRF